MENIILEIQERIKDFTKKQPSFNGAVDPDYQVYLAECARLSEIDTDLCMLMYKELPESVLKTTIDNYKEEVLKITSRR